MRRGKIQVNPLLVLSGVALVAAVVAGVASGPVETARAAAGESPGPVAVAAAVTPVVAPVVEVGNGSKVLEGRPVAMGGGSIRAWVRVNQGGEAEAVGVTFDEKALTNLPTVGGKTCCEGPSYLPELPTSAGVKGLPFSHVFVNWNPKGHEPAGVYDVPHFDFHFYMQSSEDREAITAEGPDLARCAKPLPAEQVPAKYVMAPGGVPRMGAHWVALDAPELHGQKFTTTFLYGSYDGQMTFLEPMITKAFLEGRPQFTQKLSLPAKYPAAGRYPTSYAVKFDPATRAYTVSLDGMVQRD